MTKDEIIQKVIENISNRSEEGIQSMIDYFKNNSTSVIDWLHYSREYKNEEEALTLLEAMSMEELELCASLVKKLSNGHILVIL